MTALPNLDRTNDQALPGVLLTTPDPGKNRPDERSFVENLRF